MALEPGTRFGSCHVVEPIGAGGMGEVYRASDTKLKRDVALKVLPQAFVDDTDRLARFQREAEILAALNHPNIAQVYGIEESDGLTAIVMELVEGPTLEDRIAAGPIPPGEAMGIALQIVAALEAAHDKSIVHRDLKPANIKLKDDGTVKVLDFGISKPIDPTAISGASPVTQTPAVTQTGVILGTAAYMSPEQARGKFVDDRTDVWAFGCLLFEMLTGQPAFGGEDLMLTLARVLDRDTDLSSIPKTISPAVRHTIKLCLEKDPRKRIADIRDVRLALEGTFETEMPHEVGAITKPGLGARLAGPAVGLIAGAVVMAVVTAVIGPAPAPPQITRFTIPIPGNHVFRSPGSPLLALSRDGRRLAYNTTDGFYVRDLDSLETRLVPGTSGDIGGFVLSPDGTEILYTHQLTDGGDVAERISIGGGAATIFADASWDASLDDVISIHATRSGSFQVNHRGGISEFETTGGGRLTQLLELGVNVWPNSAVLLPDDDTVVLSVWEGERRPSRADILESRLVAASLSASRDGAAELIPILPRGVNPQYVSSTGHLLFQRDNVVNAAAFDAEALTVTGEVRTVLSDVRLGNIRADYHIADNGTLAYLPAAAGVAGGQSADRLGWHHADGSFEPLPFLRDAAQGNFLRFPVLSPDNTKLVATEQGDSFDIFVYDLLRPGTRTLIAGTDANEPKAVWMPDGETLIFYRDGAGFFRRAADASDREALLLALPDGFVRMIPDWIHPDGTELVFTGFTQDLASSGLYRLTLTDGAEPALLLDEPGFNEGASSLSPDGRYIAYTTDEAGISEVHIRPYPDVTSRRWVVSSNNASDPEWDADGLTR